MNKYKVKVSHIFSEVLDVEAEDETGARKKAGELIETQNREAQINYEASLPSENWPVVTEEDYAKMVEQVKEELAKQKEENKE
jgi:hypothetical protein